MDEQLNDFQKQLLTILQTPLSVCTQPYKVIADRLGTTEDEVLSETQNLIDNRWIRSFRPQINYRPLGRIAVLATAHLEPEQVEEVGAAVSDLNTVSHNYLRDHYYNLWFTLQGSGTGDIDSQLGRLGEMYSVEFHAMPAAKLFKLNVFFNLAEDMPGQASVQKVENKTVELSEIEKTVLMKIQQPFPVTSHPFRVFADDMISEQMVIDTVQGLQEKSVIRRIGAVVNYIRLGYRSNVMFCAAVDSQYVDTAGQYLAALDLVSHCYERRTFEGFEYNMFAMMHGRDQKQIDEAIEEITTALPIRMYACLHTVRELKKKPVIQRF